MGTLTRESWESHRDATVDCMNDPLYVPGKRLAAPVEPAHPFSARQFGVLDMTTCTFGRETRQEFSFFL